MSQISLQHGTTTNSGETGRLEICSEVSVNSPGNPWSQSRKRTWGRERREKGGEEKGGERKCKDANAK